MKMQPLVHRLLVLSSCFALFSCQKDMGSREPTPELSAVARKAASEQINTFKGPQVEVGDGKARSWISVNHEGTPLVIGYEMTSEAVTSMSALYPEEGAVFVLPLHHKAQELTPFDHLTIDWNPHGHPPAGINTVPHFDFHFYMIPLEERLAIPFSPSTPVPSGYMPDGWFIDPVNIPQMGAHWSDRSVAPGTFQATMIYGSYAGEVTFVEPMITLQEITTDQGMNIAYAQPRIYQEHGVWYPTAYSYYRVGDKYYVTLSNFVWSE
jgi:hypothetical protein